MAVRTALLTSRNINLDTDFSKYIESVTTAGIISGFTVTASSVAAGTAWVPCTRTNGDTIYALVQNFSAVSISGNGHVIIKVDDTIVDNGGGNEDGTGIATIEVVANLPSKNYLELATISSGTVTPVAPTIKKLNELNTEIQSIFSQLADLDERVEHLEEADAIDHLEESGLVWELYTLNDTLFKQYAPTLANSTVEANVGDVAANTEIHVQAMGSGVASNQLKLKVKMAWAPITSLKVEVRKGIQVTVTENVEAYWYGDSNNIYATGTLASSSFSTSWQEVTFNLDNEVGGTKWELLDVVVYQTTGSGATVNASNYYVLACDSTQYSEAFSYVSVNGSTRARSKLMPYLSSDGFVQAILSKVDNSTINISLSSSYTPNSFIGGQYLSSNTLYWWHHGNSTTYPYDEARKATLFTASISGAYTFKIKAWQNATSCKFWFGTYYDNILSEITPTQNSSTSTEPTEYTITINVNAGETIYIYPHIQGGQNAGLRIKLETYSITLSAQLFKNSNTVWLPKEIKNIGTLWISTIWGIHNKEFYAQASTTTVTTWEITPGNFVGYLNIWGYKIPYYL